jgi:hypothetical protein
VRASPPSTPTREATLRAAYVIVELHAGAAAAGAPRDRQVADFVSTTGVEAHAATIAAGANEKEAAHVAQVAAGAAL